ncbi:hypothetical protein V6N13_142210 [Hibiscus sabdariffa]
MPALPAGGAHGYCSKPDCNPPARQSVNSGLPMMDVQMDLSLDDNPIEFSDGNKRPRRNVDSTGTSVSDINAGENTTISTDLIEQSRREP